MAQQVPIAGAGTSAKIRSPFACALLPFVTFAIRYVVISPAFFGYMQSGLNNVWKAQAQQQA